MSQEVRQQVLKLMDTKDKIESEIRELTSILSQNGVGMSDPLVDAEGFPISSIDIYQVRHARQKIICLQNDHKAIMKQIENGLQGYYSEANRSAPAPVADNSPSPRIAHTSPFAKVTLVSPGSPADSAGLVANDLLVEFGSVNATNFKNITDVAGVVQHSEGVKVAVKLKRGENFIGTYLIPKKWGGKGLLGCNIESL